MPQRYDSAQLLALHERLCSGDRTASEEIVELLLSPLVQAISSRFPRTDEQVVSDGVTDAILDYCRQPGRFDERHGVPLDRFLRLAAWRNVANTLRREQRRQAREERAEQLSRPVSVELDPTVGNLLQQEQFEEHQQQKRALMSTLQDPKDQQILTLRLQGERRTEVFAEILGVSHLPPLDQRRAVKQAKDRIDKILHRRKGGQL